MRFRLMLAAIALALPVSASALTINAGVTIGADGSLTGAPVAAAPGDVVVLTISVDPLATGIGGYNFAFDAGVGIEIQTLNAALSGSTSIAADRRLFSFNNALSSDLTSPTQVAVLTFNVANDATDGSDVALRAGGEIVLSDFSSVEPQGGLIVDVTAIPEPGTALLMMAGAAGLALVRRRSA